ncbi:LOW QUALITY PROTEIN: integrator complex subunit 2-like [Limulus polyphemus]|uniref:LOW QUALITY PROTEIN: integrator complex subunit 2-like n=1 Tax=Limulus polyphemus TaxID=6850 RepID=A0ABM1SX49_LIMPO|nr:LOW QUALITY PROTEIN: integrator complex subunit 2-like [Limulus polyphemus]
MTVNLVVTPRAFKAIQTVDVAELAELSEQEIRPLLPCLVRMSLCGPLDQRNEWSINKKTILKILLGIELVNSLVALLSIDFHALEIDVKENPSEYVFRSSELFDNTVYLEEVADVLCIAQAELPGLLHIPDVAEALLHVKNGAGLICRLVANAPDSFQEVCETLIKNGEKQDEETPGGRIRMQALRMLCQMNVVQTLSVRATAVEQCRMPGLAVLLTLDHSRLEQGHREATDFDSVVGDLVAFVSGLLLGNDDKVRAWFAQYVRNCQKKCESDGGTIQPLREELLQRLQNLVLFSIDQRNLPDSKVVQASSLLRLYCALRGIAGLKFYEDETNLLLQLLTSHPPPSPAGIRFVSLGVCMLLACPTLISDGDHERRASEWICWLLQEESYFGRTSGVNASFGEMLLLIAIHFHSNQTTAISDLVCSTLGMKVPIRQNNLSRMKAIFTQEIFTDQVVTAHAVKVPVTPNLCSNTTGFLPVHCIHQLLKSRAFTKHKVPIKDWIYRQICNTVPPLHPVLPPLIEVYVNSVIIPSSKSAQDTTNEPITEDEIMAVFKNSIFVPRASKNNSSRPSSRSGRSTPIAMETNEETPSSLTSQMLLLYYLLLYKDTRLANMKAILSANRKVKCYSSKFFAQLPIIYLLQQAQREQQQFAGLFSPLLRLLATHFPHLCQVEEWIVEEKKKAFQKVVELGSFKPKIVCTTDSLREAFQEVSTCSIKLLALLDHLLSLPLYQLWPFASSFASHLPQLLDPSVPQLLVDKANEVWWRLNRVFPRRLWVMTVNATRPTRLPLVALKPLILDDIVLDPLHVLRCDQRLFRCASLLEITLYMLRAFLAASRTHLTHHVLEHPLLEKTGPLEGEKDREDLKHALMMAQESAAVQILMECLLPMDEENKSEGLLTRLREVQSLICSHFHQVFIADPHLVKLIHFQGYPSKLLPITVTSIPSMHICLDFIPELLSQPQLEKQVFGIELTSYLCQQYAIPKSLSIARLCISVVHTLLGVIPSERRPQLILPALPAIVRMCKAFPPLFEDVVALLLQLGHICYSHACVMDMFSPSVIDYSTSVPDKETLKEVQKVIWSLPTNNAVCLAIRSAYRDLCEAAVAETAAY